MCRGSPIFLRGSYVGDSMKFFGGIRHTCVEAVVSETLG